VIVQATAVTRGGGSPKGMKLYDDRFIPGIAELARTIHKGGARAFLQLVHLGTVFAKVRMSALGLEEAEIIGPSAIPSLTNGVVPTEMSKQDIKSFTLAFAESCRRARDAGFDGVEVHAAHGYVLHSFLSPLTNRRDDEYGGSIENRARLVCEVIEAARAKAGPDFALTVRVSGTELLDGGIQIDDVALQAPMFVNAGADAIHVSACSSEYTVWLLPGYMEPDGRLVHLAEAVKKTVDVPVLTVGKIGNPVMADRIIEDGKADFVVMGRALLADPELPNKAREGRLDDINYCISCNNCSMILFAGGGISDFTCTVNPGLLAEADYLLQPVTFPKKVIVVGGGLACMLAARDLALRGHKVTLYEKSDRLGGQWNVVCMEEGKAGFARFSEYLKRGLKKAGVDVALNQEVTPALVTELRPDAVVLPPVPILPYWMCLVLTARTWSNPWT